MQTTNHIQESDNLKEKCSGSVEEFCCHALGLLARLEGRVIASQYIVDLRDDLMSTQTM